MTPRDQHVATTEFVDGVWREVWQTPDGRQYVLVDGEQVFGVWYMPRDKWDELFPQADRPVIVDPNW